MPLGDTNYINDSLDGVVGAWPASGATYWLFSADPQQAVDVTDVQVDLSVGGLTAPAFDPADWASAVDGGKTTTAAVSFGTSTGALDDVATYWGIVDGSGLLVFSDDLPDAIEVGAASTPVSFSPTVTFGAA